MSKGIDIAIAADTRSAMSAIQRGLIDPLEDVSDQLENIDETNLHQLERDMRDAQRRTEDAKNEVRDLRDELTKTGRAGKNAGDDINDGMRRAERGMEDLKSEANSTAREAAASFDGSAESIGDAFQEVAANAFGGFGPAGAAAGLAAAAGLGAIITAITAAKDASEELKTNLGQMYQDAAEEGRAFLSETQIQAEATRLLFQDRDKLQSEAAAIGVDAITLARAYAGSQEDANTALQAGNDAMDARLEKLGVEGQYGSTKLQAVDEESRAIESVNGLLEQQLEWHAQNKSAAEDVAELKTRGAETEREQIQRTRDADQARYEALAQQYANPIKGTVEVQVDVNTAAAYAKYDQLKRDLQSRGINVPITVQDTRGGRTWQ